MCSELNETLEILRLRLFGLFTMNHYSCPKFQTSKSGKILYSLISQKLRMFNTNCGREYNIFEYTGESFLYTSEY
jgi:hypothetical protein